VWAEALRAPELGLPAHLTLQLFDGDEVIFSSGKHWLLPLFDLEEFFAQSGHDPARTRLVDRVTGRAAALLVADRVSDLVSGVALAVNSIDQGKASAVLTRLVEITNREVPA